MRDSGQVRINGWSLSFHPDFVKFYETNRYLRRLNVGSEQSAQRLIDNKIVAICNSADPGESRYPKLGNMKWLKAKKGVKIQEERVTGDYRILFLPTDHEQNELTFFAIRDHDGVQEFLRDAHARVHNVAIDEFSISAHETDDNYTVDMKDDDAEERIQAIQDELAKIVSKTEVEQNESDFIEVARTCAIYRLGKFGIEIDPSPEQHEHINAPSPMLLPGVAGTGKSTVLHYRFRDAVMSYGENSDEFFAKALYLTLNAPLARSTRRDIKKITPNNLSKNIDSSVHDINKWVVISLGEEPDDSVSLLTFDTFRKWWSRRPELMKAYDPAQAWEEYRGVIKGTSESMKHPQGALPKQVYVALPDDRGAFHVRDREKFYTDIVKPFERFRHAEMPGQADDQDLIRRLFEAKLPPMYRYVFIDEVQDLTELQLLVIMNSITDNERCICSPASAECACPPSCHNCDCMIFDVTGDLSQQVYPTRFRWETTSRSIFETTRKKVNERNPMATSYRSVRSIVDLSAWYLEEMEKSYRQGGNIVRAQADKQKEIPTFHEGSADELYEILSNEGLPEAHCPVLTRSENEKEVLIRELTKHAIDKIKGHCLEKYPDDRELRKAEIEKLSLKATARISGFTFTVAEAKGLEWNNVILWNITSGSNYLLERKLHERQGNQIDDDDWNYQLELRHAFVATTRARLLLLHLDSKDGRHDENPFYATLQEEGLVLPEKKPVDLSQFSKVELDEEDYRKMAEDYEMREQYAAAALIYRNRLKDETKALEVEFFDAKQKGNTLIMAKSVISLEGRNNTALPTAEKRYTLEKAKQNTRDELLPQIIDLAEILGEAETANIARLQRKENLALMVRQPAVFQELAEAYQEFGEHQKSAENYLRAEKPLLAISQYVQIEDGKGLTNACREVVNYLAPGQHETHELLLLSILTEEGLDDDEKGLFQEIFSIKWTKRMHDTFTLLDVKVSTLQFRFESSKEERLHRLNQNLPASERADMCFENGDWESGLNILINEGTRISDAVNKCGTVSGKDLIQWSEQATGMDHNQQFELLEFLFKRDVRDKSVEAVTEFLEEHVLNQREHLGGGWDLHKLQHTSYIVAKDGYEVKEQSTRIGVQKMLEWYHDPDQKSELLRHAIRAGLRFSLERSYGSFVQRHQRTITDGNVREALPILEMMLNCIMQPAQFKPNLYADVRRTVLGLFLSTERTEFLDVLFAYLLDVNASENDLARSASLKKDIQIILPMYSDQIPAAFSSKTLAPLGEYFKAPRASIRHAFKPKSEVRIPRSFGPVLIMEDPRNFTKGMRNSIMRYYTGSDENLAEEYIQEFVIGHNPNVDRLCFFDSVESFLRKKGEGKQPKKRQKKSRSRKRKTQQPQSKTIAEGKPETPDVPDIDDIPSVEPNPIPEEVQDALSNARSLRIEDVIEHLENDAPEDIESWFKEHYSSAFRIGNILQIIELRETFHERLRREANTVNVMLINEWLFYAKISKLMKTKLQMTDLPGVLNDPDLNVRMLRCKSMAVEIWGELPQIVRNNFIGIS